MQMHCAMIFVLIDNSIFRQINTMVSNIMSNPFMLAEASIRQDHHSSKIDSQLNCKDFLPKTTVQPQVRRDSSAPVRPVIIYAQM